MVFTLKQALQPSAQEFKGPWALAWRRFRRHKLAVAGLVVLTLIVLLSVFAPVFSRNSAFSLDLLARGIPPSWEHLLGTDRTGRDIWARLLLGGRVSLMVGVVAVALSALIGTLVGSLAGYYGGKLDAVLMRFTDMVMMFPLLVIIVALVAVMGPSIYTSMFAIGVFGWTGIARLVRAQFLALREADFVSATRSLGANDATIIFKHILPNTVGPLAVAVTFAVGNAILLEAALSFLGLGVQAPTPSWGGMMRDAQALSTLEGLPWMWLSPGVTIMLAVLSVNFIGDGLRDALDPKALL